MSANRLGIILVNFGSHDLLRKNLAVLDLQQIDALVVVVDNFSGHQERAQIQSLSQSQNWELLTPSKNLGFGAGMNLGVEHAITLGCTSFVLLNPDVSITVSALSKLHEVGRHCEFTLLSPRINRPDGSVWFAGGQLNLRTGRTSSQVAAEQRGPERWITGACLFVDLQTWVKLKGFDLRYFLYWEDVDLSQRCLHLGGDLQVVHEVTVTHTVGATQGTQGKSPTYNYYMCRNRLLFASLNRPSSDAWQWLLHTPAATARVAFRDGKLQALTHPRRTSAAVGGAFVGSWMLIRSVLLAKRRSEKTPNH